jgi:hypothetical protein
MVIFHIMQKKFYSVPRNSCSLYRFKSAFEIPAPKPLAPFFELFQKQGWSILNWFSEYLQ